MIVVVLTAIGVCSAIWSWPRIRRLADLRLHDFWLVWLALVIQLRPLRVLRPRIPLWWANAIHFLTYGLTVVFIVLQPACPRCDRSSPSGPAMQPARDLGQRRHDARQHDGLAQGRSPRDPP